MIAEFHYDPNFHPSIGPFGLLLIVIVAIWLMLMIATAAKSRKHTSSTEIKVCSGCSTPHPGHAEF